MSRTLATARDTKGTKLERALAMGGTWSKTVGIPPGREGKRAAAEMVIYPASSGLSSNLYTDYSTKTSLYTAVPEKFAFLLFNIFPRNLAF